MDNETMKITKRITVWGVVQGVGFRPLVFRLANKYNLQGTVQNLGGLVEIMTESNQKDLDCFLEELKKNSGDHYEIVGMEVTEYENHQRFHDFRILESSSLESVCMLPPDLPVCSICQEELADVNNRRYQNPFVSCMSCGPRYTIIEELPYDRHTTTMKDYTMCPVCKREYASPTNRRFHAQTISCNDCGPYLIFHANGKINQSGRNPVLIQPKQALEEAVGRIQAGGIVAVKGIGGYHLVCSPFIEETVANLRRLKGREEKPFAVMFPSVSSIAEYCDTSKEEKALLESKARPIVLLIRKDAKSEILDAHTMVEHTMAPSTNKDSLYCGAFLPYTPLQILLTNRCGPLIMTSANVSNQPMITDDVTMLSVDSPYLNGVLYHHRRIVRSVDDSVAKIIDHKPLFLRRSRGYVPYPVVLNHGRCDLQILATGGDLKATYCLYKKGYAMISQYFGDLEEREILEGYQHSIADSSSLLQMTIDLVVCDLHPNYHSTSYAKTLGIPRLQVQHHHAHVASVVAEHQIKERVIGVAFDGTGYGTDGNVWGSEFLICQGADFIRAAHLTYTPMLGGEQGMYDAQKTATCFLIHHGLEEYCNDSRLGLIQTAMKYKINTILSSSMGRLFDAVSSLLGIQEENNYEGQCAMMIEKAAAIAVYGQITPVPLGFAIDLKGDHLELDSKPVIETICRLRGTVSVHALALGFHYAVADAIVAVCRLLRREHGIGTVALGGGVFQNTILLERVLLLLRESEFRVYYNEVLPPNDGSICLGQAYLGLMR